MQQTASAPRARSGSEGGAAAGGPDGGARPGSAYGRIEELLAAARCVIDRKSVV